MHVLLLGGTNFIGPHVVKRLLARGCDVTVFHRGKTNTPLPDAVRHLYGDHDRLVDFTDAFRAIQPDVVVEMIAGQLRHGEALISLFPGIAKRLVLVSSVDVYRAYDRMLRSDPGPPDPAPLTEDSPLRDRRFPYRQWAKDENDRNYNYDKIPVEELVLSRPDDLPAVVIRLPMVYGPGDYQHRLFPILKRMDDDRPAILLAEGNAAWRAPRGYVEDIGEAIALCAADERSNGRTYHVADEANLTQTEWVQRIGETAEWNGRILALPREQLPEHLHDEYDYTQHWSLDSSRIRSELGYQEITPPELAMARTVAWERANLPSKIDEEEFDYAAEDRAIDLVSGR